MNSITELLDLEDTDIIVSDVPIEGTEKTLTLETHPTAHYCPCCGFRMHSRGIKQRRISHPILQDGYSLRLILKQRRWRCPNPDCRYEANEEFRFVSKSKRTTKATGPNQPPQYPHAEIQQCIIHQMVDLPYHAQMESTL